MISAEKTRRREQLAARGERIEKHLEELKRIEARYPWIRLAVFLAGAGATITAFSTYRGWVGWAILAFFLVLFLITALLHRKVLYSLRCFELLRRISLETQARARLDWAGIPRPAGFDPIKDHPFEFDLNITGERSLHQLLDTAASLGGSARLRGWLLQLVPDMPAVQTRQALLRELLPLSGFRGRMQLSGALITTGAGHRWDGEGLLRWLNQQGRQASLGWFVAGMAVLAAVNIGLFVLNVRGLLPAYWLGTLALFWALQGLKYRETGELFNESYRLGRDLDQFRAVLAELEAYRYLAGSALQALCRPFWSGSRRPSASLRRLSVIVTAASFRSNPFLGLFLNTVLPWDLFFTYLLERYKAELREVLPTWLDRWYELEALLSLATFSRLNPEAAFPVIADWSAGPEQPVFAGKQLAHPLIPAESRVGNDFRIQQLGQIFIVTGSNMSGKSTFLRTLGVNLCLAYAGSVVCAGEMSTRLFRLFTSINLSDSLSDGISYFYAEVRRLKALLSALGQDHPLPLFFLIDEIFRGTNNRERQVGSLAYTQALAGRNGTGLISTHDLELVHLADEIPGIQNYHFREDVSGGVMVFDYQLRPGPSPTTNALKIMALEGLPVPAEGSG